MSLINNMLKDLEKRQKPAADIPYLLISTSSSATRLRIRTLYGLGLFLIVSVCVITLLFFLQNQKSTLIVTPMLKNTLQTPVNAAVENIEWLRPITITGITVQMKDNMTELSFLLDHAALYRLTRHAVNNEISLIIEQSKLQSSLPRVDELNTGIQRLTSQNINGDTYINILLNAGATIKYIDLNSDNKNPELVMAIEHPSIETATESQTTTQIIKTPALQSFLSKHYQSALTAAQNGEYQTAIKQLQSVLKLDPQYHDARVALSALLIEHHQSSQAKKIIEEGLSLTPNYVPFTELKARILTLEGQVTQALVLLQHASPAMNENPDYYALMAALYERENNDVLAVQLYNQLLNVNPHNGNWWFGLGVSLEKSAQPKEATIAYTRAMTEGRLNSESLIYLQKRLQALQGINDEKR